MRRMIYLAIIIPGILIASAAMAQNQGRTIDPQFDAKQQSRIDATFNNEFSGLNQEDIEWRQDNDGYYNASFSHRNRDYTTTFDKDGNWLRTSERVRMNDLPQNFRSNLTKEYKESDISEVNRVRTKDNETYFDVSVRGQNGSLRFNQDGQRMGNKTGNPDRDNN